MYPILRPTANNPYLVLIQFTTNLPNFAPTFPLYFVPHLTMSCFFSKTSCIALLSTTMSLSSAGCQTMIGELLWTTSNPSSWLTHQELTTLRTCVLYRKQLVLMRGHSRHQELESRTARLLSMSTSTFTQIKNWWWVAAQLTVISSYKANWALPCPQQHSINI